MAKRHMLVDLTKCHTLKQPKSQINWDFCALCQLDTSEALQCPAKSSKKPAGVGYVSLANDLLEFKQLGVFPMGIDLARLDEGTGFQDTLSANTAKWHKSCRLKFNQNEISRHKRAMQNEMQPCTSMRHTRSADSKPVQTELPVCFFCNDAGSEKLHEVATKQMDANVRKYAIQLEDTELLAKLSPGDMIALEAKYHLTCLTKLYNRARQTVYVSNDDEACLHSLAFAELVAFIDDVCDNEYAPIFKLADLGEM